MSNLLEYNFKLVFLGGANVGKTSLVKGSFDDTFAVDEKSTVGSA